MMEFSHQELSLLVFALEGERAAASNSPSCEESCPVVEDLDDLFGGGSLPHEKKLVRHLNNHLREGLIECGMFEIVAAKKTEDQAKLRQVNERLKLWKCEMKLESDDLRLLDDALSRLPRAAWISMPRTMWRLRKKLRAYR